MFTQLNHAKTLLYVWNYGIGPEGMVYIIEGLSGHIPRPPSYERERETSTSVRSNEAPQKAAKKEEEKKKEKRRRRRRRKRREEEEEKKQKEAEEEKKKKKETKKAYWINIQV